METVDRDREMEMNCSILELIDQLQSTVESTEGMSEIWFCEPFPRWGFLRFRVRLRFTSG